jgi:quercetin dioxygenase-like cupin family protein
VEALLVLRGTVRVEIDRQPFTLHPGDCIYYDASQPHAYFNASRDQESVIIWMASRREVD